MTRSARTLPLCFALGAGCLPGAPWVPGRDTTTSPADTGQRAVDTDTDTAVIDTAIVETGADTSADPDRIVAVSRGSTLPDLSGYPLPINAAIQVESGFGPRLLPLEGDREDVHLGLDYDAPEGEPAYAIADGTVARVDAGGETDGNTLYLSHAVAPFTWHGVAIAEVFTVYSHLSSFAVREGDTVTAGQVVAASGATGAAVEPHLHFEVRVGTRCTLKYATEHADSTCGLGFDPAINPYHLVPGSVAGGLTVSVLAEEPFTLRVSTAEVDLDLNRVETDLGAVDFDLREGIDATSDAGLDTLDYGWMHLAPDARLDDPAAQAYTLTFPTRPAYVEVLDFRGDGWRVMP